MNLSLHPEHIADLQKSGLSSETIRSMGVYSVRPCDISRILGWEPKEVQSALAFPYLTTDGFIRLKVFPPQKDAKGHSVKYLQSKGTGTHLYVLPKAEEVLRNPSIPLAIAEGEKKTAALIEYGITAIGVGGIWSWLDGKTHQPIPELDQIAWVEREVKLYFDSDIWHRPDLLRPVYALGKELEDRGAEVEVVVLDQKGEDKIGIDDFLVNYGLEDLAKLKTIPLAHKAFNQASKWWKNWKDKVSKGAKSPSKNLKAFIHDIRKTSRHEMAGFEKRQKISEAATHALIQNGDFYITPEKQSYFFDKESGKLLSLKDDDFLMFVSDLTGLNPVEIEFNYLHRDLVKEASRRGKETNVYGLAHYNKNSGRLYVSDFGGGVWVLDGQNVSRGRNGQDGILFLSSPLAMPFRYIQANERPEGADIPAFLAPINFDQDVALSPDECRSLLFIWLLSMFFPELHPTKVIPAFIGPQGSTKTSTARRFGILLMGHNFNVGHLEPAERGEHAFIATVCGKPFAAFDNADAPIKWLPDRLATFATGHEFELRELYTTNKLAIYKPTAHLVLTSRDPYFRRPDVAERLLIVRLNRPSKFIPESAVLAQLIQRRDGIWSDLLDVLNQTLLALKEVPEAPPFEFRMADFISFGWRLSKARGGEEAAQQFINSIKKLEKEQANYATEEDQVATCLAYWLEEESNFERVIDTAALYSELNEIAKREGFILVKTSPAFGKRLHLNHRAVETSLGVKIRFHKSNQTTNWRFSKQSTFVESSHSVHSALDLECGERGENGQFQESY
jgi:hypothetical protein